MDTLITTAWTLLLTCDVSGEPVDDRFIAEHIWVRPAVVVAVADAPGDCAKVYTSLGPQWYVKGSVDEIKGKLGASKK